MARSALVQDWFYTPGGAERVMGELAQLLPEAPIYTSFADAESARHYGARLRTWPLQRVFPGTRAYRRFLPLYPWWFGGMNLRSYDLVVSSSSAFAKAVRTRPNAVHVAYVHAPMRYAWDLETYLSGSSFSLGTRVGGRLLRPLLRRWDVATSRRPNVIVANSAAVQARIQRFWGRESEVVHPPVDVSGIELGTRDDGFVLIAARMLAYRRLDLAVDAANTLGRELVLVGDGPERQRLEARAAATIRFAGTVDRATLLDLLARCHAYLVPGEEDFGIAPVEAMAAGKPVIAYAAGGALETVIDGETGLLFHEPSSASLADAIRRLDSASFDPQRIRRNAERFDASVFRSRMVGLFERLGVDRSLYQPPS